MTKANAWRKGSIRVSERVFELWDSEGQEPHLSMPDFNATGASVVLKMSGDRSWATTVTLHAEGANSMTYSDMPEFDLKLFNGEADGHYFLENKLQFLDEETEWFFDKEARTLHLKTKGDQHPCELHIQARVQEHAFRIIDTQHLALRGLKFFGASVWAASLGHSDSVHGIKFDSLRFTFPNAQKRMLGDHTFHAPTTLFTRNTTVLSQNAIVNCSFEGAETGPVLYLNNAGLLMSNNRFSWNDWTALGCKPCWPRVQSTLLQNESIVSRDFESCHDLFNMSSTSSSGACLDPGQGTAKHPTIVRRTTVEHFGSSSGIFCRKNCDLSLNDVSHASDLPWTGGALLDSPGHDLHEYIDEIGRTAAWIPPVCTDFNKPPHLGDESACISLGGCSFDGTRCSGFPTEIDQLPVFVSDVARYGTKVSILLEFIMLFSSVDLAPADSYFLIVRYGTIGRTVPCSNEQFALATKVSAMVAQETPGQCTEK